MVRIASRSNKIILCTLLHSFIISCGSDGFSGQPVSGVDLDNAADVSLLDSWIVGDGNVKFDVDCPAASIGSRIGYSLTTENPTNFAACSNGVLEVPLPPSSVPYTVSIWGSPTKIIQTFVIYSVTQSFQIEDPTPELNGSFGGNFVDCSTSCVGSTHILANGNIVVAQPNDSSVDSNAGSVFLFDGASGQIIQKFSGDQAGDQYGSAIKELPNGNFVIVNSSDDNGLTINAGSVLLVNGATGTEISRVIGNDSQDQLGLTGIDVLPNSNFIIRSHVDDKGAIIDAGSAILVDGSTGIEIGRVEGDQDDDKVGSQAAAILPNGNYVIASFTDDNGAISDAGSVILVNGSTGNEVSRLSGDRDDDQLGLSVTPLSNNNYIVTSYLDDDGVTTINAGSIILVNGSTGNEIARVTGDQSEDRLGLNGVVVLSNGNFTVASSLDNENATSDTGSVLLMDANSGAVISTLYGDQATERVGLNGVTALTNGNYTIASRDDDSFGSVIDAGSVILVNGSTGSEISRIEGNQINDEFGSEGTVALQNGNYVIASPNDDSLSHNNAGSVVLVDGSTGIEISRFEGMQSDDLLGSDGVVALSNDNFVVLSSADDSGALNGGSIMVVNGSNGTQISRIVGDQANDRLGGVASGFVTILGNSSFVVGNYQDNNGSTLDAGSVMIIDSQSGELQKTIYGTQISQHLSSEGVIDSPLHKYFVIADDLFSGTFSNSGQLQLIPYE